MATAAFFRERAEQAQGDADRAILENVRNLHLNARDSWLKMAEKADDVVKAREKNEVEKAAAQSFLPAD